MQWPMVSVIIPFYKGIVWLEEAIKSVIKQNYPNIEIIVINDGSPEDLSGLRNKHRDMVIWINQHNQGPAAARNVGIDLAKGKYIALLDADDLWKEGKLFWQVSKMEQNQAIWSHHSFEMFWESDNNRVREIDTKKYQGNVLTDCYVSFKVQTACFMIRRSALIENNIRYPNEKRFGEDIVFYKMLATRWPLYHYEGVYARLRVRGSNAGLNARIQLLDRASVWIGLKKDKEMQRQLPRVVVIGYRLAFLLAKPVERLSQDSRVAEVIAKISYLSPYIFFKLGSLILNKRRLKKND